ncbi:hypothetical protein JCM11251_002638 [Rhodosporidiobolus azoricus]
MVSATPPSTAPDPPAIDRLSSLPTEISQAVFRHAGPGKHLYLSKRLLSLAREEQFCEFRIYREKTLDQVARVLETAPHLKPLVRRIMLWLQPPYFTDNAAEEDWFAEEWPKMAKTVQRLCLALTGIRVLELPTYLASSLFLWNATLPTYPRLSRLSVVVDPSFQGGFLAAALPRLPNLKKLSIEIDLTTWDDPLLESEDLVAVPRRCAMPSPTAPRLDVLDIHIRGPNGAWLRSATPALTALGGALNVTIHGLTFEASVVSILAALPANVESLALRKRYRPIRPVDETPSAFSGVPAGSGERGRRIRRGLGDGFKRFSNLSSLHLDFPVPSFVWQEQISTLPSLQNLHMPPSVWPSTSILTSTVLHRRSVYPNFTHFKLHVNLDLSDGAKGQYQQRLDLKGAQAAQRYLRAAYRVQDAPSVKEEREHFEEDLGRLGWRVPIWEGPVQFPAVRELTDALVKQEDLLDSAKSSEGHSFFPLKGCLLVAWMITMQLMQELKRFSEAEGYSA